MLVKIIENLDDWNDRQLPFAQSWEWGEILLNEGKKVLRLAVFEQDILLAKAEVFTSPVIFGWKYAFCPKGPVFNDLSLNGNAKKEVIAAISKFLSSEGIFFLRIEPRSEVQAKRIVKTIDINPRATFLLNLTKSEQELLEGMHSKTRYNIRLAEKKELTCRWEKNLPVFLQLMFETGKRDNFRLHHKSHYENIFKSNLSSQLTIYHRDQPVAVGVFVGSGETFTYLYGASSYESRHLMAPYLIQWQGILKAKELGYKWYDFFGVAPQISSSVISSHAERSLEVDKLDSSTQSFHSFGRNDNVYEYDPKHQYAGVTRFKLGFGGVSQIDPGTYDFLIDRKKYWVYQLIRAIRRFF